MKIQKRDGTFEAISLDKIRYRLQKLKNDKILGILDIDIDTIALKVVSSIYDGVSSRELDEEASRIAVSMSENPEFQQLGSRIIISNHHKSTNECFSEVMEALYNNTDKSGKHSPILADDVIEIIRGNKNVLNFEIDYNRDYMFDYFGFKTLEKSYLLKIYNKDLKKMVVAERPQHLYMRVAIGIHKNDIKNILKTYHLISQHYYTHATPTLFNSGTRLSSLSSCFLIGTEDSLEGIFKTMTDCAKISKLSGGIGFHVSNIRAKGSIIRGTNGTADGLVPMLKVYNEISKYIDQGGGKRKGSFCSYLEPWHADIMDFLDLKKNQGSENIRARDLFYAIWMPDLFMKTVEENGDWFLMCPDECPGLSDVYGEEFEKLYWSYVKENKHKKVVKAQEIWTKILELQIEKGVPYIGYKDAVNKKCNQKNLGTIKSSNLCLEISLYSDKDEYGTCNLSSVALPKFVEYDESGTPFFNFEKLREISEYIIEPMNKVIDNNHYPTPEAKYSNMKNRPLGIGVQGLADVYFKMRLPSDSKEAVQLNKEIFETLYYGCMQGTINASKKDGPYESFSKSPFSEGKLQFDLSKEFDNIDLNNYLSGRWDWDSLRKDLVKYGARNSMLTALMPTASTAQIMNNSEAFELVDSCIFKRRVLSGEFMVVNKYLVKELQNLGLWNLDMKNLIIANDGSIQNINTIPDNIKLIYRNVWETSMKSVIDQAKDRQVFVDQMQSMNLFMANPTISKLTSMHFYAWRNPEGKPSIKSGQYYLRSKSSYQSGKFSIDANLEKQLRDTNNKSTTDVKEVEVEEECLACGS